MRHNGTHCSDTHNLDTKWHTCGRPSTRKWCSFASVNINSTTIRPAVHTHNVCNIFSPASLHWCVCDGTDLSKKNWKNGLESPTSSKITSYAFTSINFIVQLSRFWPRPESFGLHTRIMAYVIHIYAFDKRKSSSRVNWKVNNSKTKKERDGELESTLAAQSDSRVHTFIRNWLTYRRHLIWLHARCFPLNCSQCICRGHHHRFEHVWYSNDL